MDLGATLGISAAALALAVLAGWRGARPPDLSRGPRLIPWRWLMLLSATLGLLALAHAASLVGFGGAGRP